LGADDHLAAVVDESQALPEATRAKPSEKGSPAANWGGNGHAAGLVDEAHRAVGVAGHRRAAFGEGDGQIAGGVELRVDDHLSALVDETPEACLAHGGEALGKRRAALETAG